MHMAAQFRTEPTRYRFSRDEYFQMCEQGLFIDKRVQLIGGEIIEMPAQGNFHLATIRRIERLLEAAFGSGFWVRMQGTLDLAPHGVPDPDIAVIEGNPDEPSLDLPTGSLLVAEISDSTLSYDRNAKASLYAASDIQEYWIVNIPDRQLEVRREPTLDASGAFGYKYKSLMILKSGEAISPLTAPEASIPIEKMFFYLSPAND
jgi:Uma2 family endonuclease